jgi:membrane-bound lytic murein transglycosylase D
MMRVSHAVSLALSLLLTFPALADDALSDFSAPETVAETLVTPQSGALLDPALQPIAEAPAAGQPESAPEPAPHAVAELRLEQNLAPVLQLSPALSGALNAPADTEGGAETEPSPLLPPDSDLWERIRMGFALQNMATPLLQEHENWYASRPDYVRRMVERSQRYLFHIVEEVEKRGMPTEIALLPMIESAFNPKAYSRAHASGIWQFIPSTGKHFGLQQNWWYDGRRDIMAATDAALDYLQKLYEMFGSWELALSAYNWGEGNVMRAVERNDAKGLPTDFLSLRMPPETRNYLPKLLAIKNIIANPEAFGIALAPIPNRPYFVKVAADRHIDLTLAARLAEMPEEEFASLNPAHNRPVINSKDTDYLLLPVDKVDIFTSNLENYDKPLVSWGAYTLGRGEKLDRVARKFSLSVAQLKEINGISGKRRLSGGTLLVPLGEHAANRPGNALSANFAVREEPVNTSGASIHVVKKGDTVLGIARRYDISPQQIQSLNRLKSNRIAIGQKLVLARPAPEKIRVATSRSPQSSKTTRAETRKATAKSAKVAQSSAKARSKPAATQYTVRRGDTLSSIAKRHNVAANDIQRWNKLSAKRPLNPGLKVTLFIPRS